MKVGDLVKMYWLSVPAIGIVLEVKRTTCTLMTQEHGVIEVEKGHVSREVNRTIPGEA